MVAAAKAKLFWLIGTNLLVTLGAAVHRVKVHARSSRIPATGPVLIIANHLSTTEPLAVAKFIVEWGRRYPHFLAKEEVLQWPVIGTLARWMRVIPVARGTAAAGEALVEARKKLEEGAVVCMYPEGHLTTQYDLSVDTFKTGAARLALSTPGVTVVPLGQWGAKPGKWRARFSPLTRCRANFLLGEPLDLSPWAGREDPEAVREVTAYFREAIVELVAEVKGR